MTDAMRAAESAKPVLLRDTGGVAEILDQLERAAEGENLGALDLLDLGGEPPRIAGIPAASQTPAASPAPPERSR